MTRSARTAESPQPCFTATNYARTQAGRAYQSGGNAYDQAMGLWNTFVTTTLRQTGQNSYEVVGSTC